MSACKNSSCACTFQSPPEIKAVIERIEDSIQKDSMDYYSMQKYGYNLGNTFLTSDRRLKLYLRTLKRHYHQLITCKDTTLNCKSVSTLTKSVNRIINLMPCHKEVPRKLEVDKSNLVSWVVLNPNCVSKERWESCVCGMIPKYTLTVKNFEELCNLIFEIKTEIVNCDLQYALSFKEIDCKIDTSLKKELINCGLSVPLINKAIDCGLTFKHIDGELGLVGVNGVKLKLTDITGLDTGCLT